MVDRRAAALIVFTGCNYGPPPPTDAPPPAQCQQIIDQCLPVASGSTVSAADDCVRIAQDMTTTAQRCVEIQPSCSSACSPVDASAGE